MADLPLWAVYAVASVSATISALVFVPAARSLAFRFGILDHPVGYKQHGAPIPYLGGIAVAGSVIVGVLIAGLAGLPLSIGQAAVILAMSAVLVVVGLIDDIRNLSPLVRVAAQAMAAVVVILAGSRVQIFDSMLLEIGLTVVWVVGITNGLNLLDNMDGLAAGVATVTGGWLFVIASLNGQYLVSAVLVAMCGAALGFLRHNRHPASIYLGDAGSLFLGFLLAVCAMGLRFDAPVAYTWVVPVLALAVPILDTTLVVVTRLGRGVSPFRGGRDHISHRLVLLGLSVPSAVLALCATAASFGLLAFVVSRAPTVDAYWIAGGAFALAAAGLVWLARRTGATVRTAAQPQVAEGPA
jgi:UDP-GlcNAc:undecaprenyl-phosphate GlcNAc-1-phosphate transferase